MRRKRFLAAIIDFAIILLIGQLLMLLNLTHINYVTNIIFSLIFTLIICKDNMNGQSVGKYLMRIQIVDLQTDIEALNIKTMIRNIFLCLWPIEVIFFLIKPDRRLGDYVSKTKLIEVSQSQPLKLSKSDLKALLICFVIVLALSSLGVLFSSINFPLVKLLFK
ncbi:RDD family protein [Parabacteroides sp. FAFU027]|uniref:RDD family protein n=1 Tax=Parabacteroides sp. FAFU027 TaxID=2922715 RepID=UPI00397D7CD1